VIFLDGLDQLQEEANGGFDLSFLPPEPGGGIVLVLATPTYKYTQRFKAADPTVCRVFVTPIEQGRFQSPAQGSGSQSHPGN